MANSFKNNPIVLDTFSSAIDVAVGLGFPAGTHLILDSIEWQVPSTAGHTALVSDSAGNIIFQETCVTANQSIVKYFYKKDVSDITIAASGVASGKIVIVLV